MLSAPPDLFLFSVSCPYFDHPSSKFRGQICSLCSHLNLNSHRWKNRSPFFLRRIPHLHRSLPSRTAKTTTRYLSFAECHFTSIFGVCKVKRSSSFTVLLISQILRSLSIYKSGSCNGKRCHWYTAFQPSSFYTNSYLNIHSIFSKLTFLTTEFRTLSRSIIHCIAAKTDCERSEIRDRRGTSLNRIICKTNTEEYWANKKFYLPLPIFSPISCLFSSNNWGLLRPWTIIQIGTKNSRYLYICIVLDQHVQ